MALEKSISLFNNTFNVNIRLCLDLYGFRREIYYLCYFHLYKLKFYGNLINRNTHPNICYHKCNCSSTWPFIQVYLTRCLFNCRKHTHLMTFVYYRMIRPWQHMKHSRTDSLLTQCVNVDTFVWLAKYLYSNDPGICS